MSTGIELIPAALVIGAVVARRRLRSEAARAAAGQAAEVLTLETRFGDQALVREALGEHAIERAGVVHGVVGEVPIALAADADGSIVAYFHADLAAEDAEAALRTLDEAYAGLVQRDVRGRVMANASQHGLTVEDEAVEEDGSIVLTLRVDG